MDANERVSKRLIRTLFVFLSWFFIVTVVSYYVLPEGLLRSTNEIKEIVGDTSPFRLCISIFLRNLMPVLFLGIGCLVALRIKNTNYPFSYLGLFTIFTINGITRGT